MIDKVIFLGSEIELPDNLKDDSLIRLYLGLLEYMEITAEDSSYFLNMMETKFGLHFAENIKIQIMESINKFKH